MPKLRQQSPSTRPGGLTMLAVLAWLLLSACLPLQVGVERPATATPPATAVALQPIAATSPSTATASASPRATRAGETPLAGVTVTSSPTASATEAAAPSGTSAPPGTPTNRPTARPIVECALTHTVRQGERLFAIGALYGVQIGRAHV